MKIRLSQSERASTLVVTISVVATILVLLGAAVEYTQHVSRITLRTRKTALAMEIADGHLETLFTNWRNISRVQVNTAIKKKVSISAIALPTQYFFTDVYNPGPTASPDPTLIGLTAPPPLIALPSKSLFPTEPNYTIAQYRIQAVDPMTTVNTNEDALINGVVNPAATPPAAFGPNTSTSNGQYSYFYLAAVDVQVPAIGTQSGLVTAKVRRVFEKKYDQPFTFAMFYHDDLELQPTQTLTITGPVQTNSNLYIGTSQFVAQAPSIGSPTSGKVSFSNSYVNGASPKDPLHTSFTIPNFPVGQPPSMQAAYLPYGWNLNLDNSTTNNQSYHDLIERPDPVTDPISTVRFYNQADYRVLIDGATFTITDKTGATSGSSDFTVISKAITTSGSTLNQAIIQDVREGGPVRVTTVDVNQISKNSSLGMIYISDITADTAKRGIRLINGSTLFPISGLTVVSENPVYIQGDFNTGGSPPSNSGNYTVPYGSAYTKYSDIRPAAIVADAINILSNAWNDGTPTSSRVAANTTVNAALVSGNVPSDGTHYSGGGENFIRFLENWSTKSFTYYGSMVQLWASKQGTGFWNASASVYTSPTNNNWFYDTNLGTKVPPGNFQLAAYLQQQRWYQVY